jgi:branched-chain amino acid aminotransferase
VKTIYPHFSGSSEDSNNSSLYGSGVFTTIAIIDGQPFLLDKHWQRITRNCGSIGIDLSQITKSAVEESLMNTVDNNNVTVGRCRLTFRDERQSPIWSSVDETVQATSLHIMFGERRSSPEPFKLTSSPYPINSRSPLAGVKSCSYLENILAIDEAKGRDFHEAVRVNERGHLASACMANVFWLKDDVLYTPSLATGCLAGTTREFVMENVECREVEVLVDELDVADAVYLTSAGWGIVRVAEYNGRRLQNVDHPIEHLWPPQSA